jgi:hypothetical protein
MKQYSKRRLSRKPLPVKKSSSITSKRRVRPVSDGQCLLGSIAENKRTCLFLARDAQGRRLGQFQNQQEAENAIGEAAHAAEARKAATAAALAWVNRPNVEWMSGLPGHSIGRRP